MPTGPRTTGRWAPRLAVLAVIAAACAGGGAYWWKFRGGDPKPAEVYLVASGDTAGWITPCGCTTGQLGGLLRRGAYIDGLRGKGNVVYVDVGGAPAGASAYQRAKFEAILAGEMKMGLVAHNIGRAEAALGAECLHEMAARLGAPLISANLRDAGGKPVAEATRVVESNGRRLAVVGVVSPKLVSGGLRADEPRAAILNAVASAGQYDALVVLAYLPDDELAQLAAALPEADVVLGGPTGQAMAPRQVGPVVLASATNKGKFLVQLQVPRQSHQPWTGQVIEMGTSLPDSPEQVANHKRFLSTLKERDFAAADTALVAGAPANSPRSYRVVGHLTCRFCHDAEHKQWEMTRHAHAWASLTAKGAEVDPYCQSCHTTGYGMPGGFVSILKSQRLIDIACESCHGPSLAHALDPKVKTAYAAADQCVRCHDHENSPEFDYNRYWPKIQHGPAKKLAAKEQS